MDDFLWDTIACKGLRYCLRLLGDNTQLELFSNEFASYFKDQLVISACLQLRKKHVDKILRSFFPQILVGDEGVTPGLVIAYMLVHAAAISCSLLWAMLLWDRCWLHTMFAIVIVMVAVWNGSTFYLKTIANAYESSMTELYVNLVSDPEEMRGPDQPLLEVSTN